MVLPELHLEDDKNELKAQQAPMSQTRASTFTSMQLKTNSRVIGAVPIVTGRIGHIADWIVAVTVPAVLFFTIAVNVYYFAVLGNSVQMTFPDVFASEKEWLFPPGSFGVLDENIMYDFLSSSDPQVSLNLTNALRKPADPATFNPDAPCIALTARDGGSMYGLCDKLDKKRLPHWASDFEALTIQSAYLSSVQEFYDHVTKSYSAVYQAFPNERKGWLQQDTIKRLMCTTPQAAKPVSGFQSRVIYTNEFGVLKLVDCSKAEFSGIKECHAVASNPRITMFDDGTGTLPYIDTYAVFQSDAGAFFILHPFPSKDKIGKHTVQEVLWPVDNCLYMRDGLLGWFGVGFTMYTVQIPTIALIAKIELISAISLIWLVHYSFNPRYAHHSLYVVSRLGVFGVLVLQIVVSAYYEQDIMRTIFSWPRSSGTVAILFSYVLCSVSMSVSLVALLGVRVFMEACLSTPGCILSIAIGFVAALSEILIAKAHYSEYSIDNGLLPGPTDCPIGYTGCSTNKFNYLYLIYLWVVLPVLVEIIRVARICAKRLHSVGGPQTQPVQLTTFEMKCLDGVRAVHYVRDMPDTKVVDEKHRQIADNIICACGFTTIHNRFLVRTKDLWMLLLAQVSPMRMAREVSTVVWPLKLTAEGYYEVTDAKRVYISGIRRVHLHKHQNSSLIHGTHHSLA